MQAALSILFCIGLVGVPWAAIVLLRRTYALIEKGSANKWTWIVVSLVGIAAGLTLSFVWYAPSDTQRVMGIPFPVGAWERISAGTWIPFPFFMFLPWNVLFGLCVIHLGLLLFKRVAAR